MAQTPQLDFYESRTSSADAMPGKVTPHRSPEGVSEGLAGVGEIIDKKMRADGATKSANTMSNFRAQMAQSVLDTQGNSPPDGAGYMANVLGTFDKSAADAMKAVGSNPYAKKALTNDLAIMRGEEQLRAVKWQAETNTNFKATSAEQRSNQDSASIQANPERRQEIVTPNIRAIQEAGFEPGLRGRLSLEVASRADVDAAIGYARQQPRALWDEITKPTGAGDIGEVVQNLTPAQREAARSNAADAIVRQAGDGIVNTYKMAGPKAGGLAMSSIDKMDLPPELQDQVRQHAIAGLNQNEAQAKQVHAKEFIGLHERIASGKATLADKGTAYDLYNKGAIGPNEMGGILGTIDRQAEAGVEADSGKAWYADAFANNKAVDVANKAVKDGGDAFFLDHVKGEQPFSPAWTNFAATMADKTGLIPDTVVSQSRAALVGGDPVLAAKAAEAITRMAENSPRGIPFAFDSKTLNDAAEIRRMTGAAVDPVTAVNIVRANQNMPEPQRKLLETKYAKLQPNLSASGALKGILAKDETYEPHIWSSLPARSDELLGEFTDLSHSFFMANGGDLQQARASAADAIKRDWRISNINGAPALMKFAPEAMYPGRIDRESFVRDVSDYLKTEKIDADPSKVRLMETPETASTRGQMWTLQVADKSGFYETLFHPSGRPIRYEIPIGQNEGERLRREQLAEAKAANQVKWEAQKKAEAQSFSEVLQDQQQRNAGFR